MSHDSEEERELQEAIRLSLTGQESSPEAPKKGRKKQRANQAAEMSQDSEEERELQEAIRLSMKGQEPSPEPSTKGGSSKKKRDAARELSPPPLKRSRVAKPNSVESSVPTITFPHGALRITRTPGRKTQKNCINLGDLIHKNHLVSACVYAFFIARNELFRHLPLSDSSNDVPVGALSVLP